MNYEAFKKLSYGVYIVSTWNEGKATGCVANSIMQITSSPATVAISLNHNNFTRDCVLEGKKFAVSILSENTDPALIGKFGYSSGRDVDKFADYGYALKENMPVVEQACAYLVCNVINTMETSTHTVILGEVVDADVLKDEPEMTYSYYHKVIKGKSPKSAPTYIPEEN